ncbi:MAG: ATP-binding protein [Planctomycetota bacterium]
MFITRVSLRRFKRLAEFDAELAPGVNVIAGPNEAGKSSFLEALRAAFFEKATTTAKGKIGRWTTWGTDAAPEIVVEFESASARYRLRKRFARSKGQAELVELLEERTLADSPKAVQDRLGEIIEMGDAAFLCSSWVEQGRIEDALEGAGSRQDLRARLREASVDAVSALDFRSAIRKGKNKACPPKEIKALRASLDEAERTVEQFARQRDGWAEQTKRADRDVAELAPVAARLAQITPQLERDRDYQTAGKARERAKRDLEVAERALGDAEEAGGKLAELRREIEEAERACESARAEDRAAGSALRLLRAQERRVELEALVEKLRGIDEQIEQCRADAERPAPDRDEIDSLDDKTAEATKLRERLDAAKLRVEIEALRDVEVSSGAARATVPAGERTNLSGDTEVVFELDSSARVTVRGPVQDVSKLRKKLDALQKQLGEAFGGYRVTSLADARELAERATRAAHDMKRLTRERSELVARRAGAASAGASKDPASRPALEEELAELRSRIEELSADAPSPVPDDIERAEEASRAASGRLAALEEKLKGLRRDIDYWQQKQSDVEKLAEEKRDASLRFVAAETAAEELARFELPARHLLTLSEEEKELARRRTSLQARVEYFRQQTPPVTGEEFARAGDERDELERRLGTVQRDRRAYDLLEKTYVRAREEFASTDEKVISACIERLLPRLTSGRYDGADLDEKFSLATVSGPAAEEGAPVGELSVGAREQLALALRLSLVEALSRGERQLVVLDEALLGFDAERLDAACAILAEYADRFQLLILTARPELLRFPDGTDVNEIELGPRG